jgi:drug/metabolite transporter (DMT)-like permease
MAIVLALLSALAYGTSDFSAGLASRQAPAAAVSIINQVLGLAAALVGLLVLRGSSPDTSELAWGALSGVGSAVGTLALYRGLAVAPMTIVATVSAVLTAVIPVVVGVLLGNHLGVFAAAGIVIALPSILLVSWQPPRAEGGDEARGLAFGALAGVGFALLFIALDQAGTRAGAWPVVPGQIVSIILLAPFAARVRGASASGVRPAARLIFVAGVLSGTANLLFLAATGHGQLAIVAVVTALYPAFTVILARILLGEAWSRAQVAGLLASTAAIVLVSLG